jgi:hypothetical protein
MGVGGSKYSRGVCGRVPYATHTCIVACAYTGDAAYKAGIDRDVMPTLEFDESDGPFELSTLAKIRSGADIPLTRAEWMSEHGFFKEYPTYIMDDPQFYSHPTLRVASKVANLTSRAVLVNLDPVSLVVYPGLPVSVLAASRVDDIVLWARESIPTDADADADADGSVVVTLKCEKNTKNTARIEAIKVAHPDRLMRPKKPPAQSLYVRPGRAKPETLVW